MKIIKLNENDIENLVKKIINEDNEFPRGGIVYGGKAEIVDEVINRVNQYGDDYIKALKELNDGFPSTKYKRIMPSTDVKHSPGIKVKSTVYPTK